MKRYAAIFTLAIALCNAKAFAFNLWHDIQQETQWTLGDAVAAGTAIDVRNGQYDASALAQISQYRFLSLWYGGTFIPQSDKTLKAIDTAKIGFNLSYLFTGFANKPPAVLQHLVIGPSWVMPLFTTPHQGIFMVDINYQFGATANPGPLSVKQ